MTFVSRRAFLGALALCALLGLAHAERISISTQDGVETKREALRSRALQVPQDIAGFLMPNPPLGRTLLLRVSVPANIVSVFKQKEFTIAVLRRRLAQTRWELRRVQNTITAATNEIDSVYARSLRLQKQFHVLHQAHAKASRGATVVDHKDSYVTLYPLLEVAKKLRQARNEQSVLVKTWQQALPMVTDMRLALQKSVLRLQRRIVELEYQTVQMSLE